MSSNKANRRSTAVGCFAMYYADSTIIGRETFNTAIGYESLKGSTIPSDNTGVNNTAIGDQALYSNTSGVYNTSVGSGSMNTNNTGSYNAVFGALALNSSLNSTGNTVVGYGALLYNTLGDRNTTTGCESMENNNSGKHNTAMGWRSLLSNSNGDYNVSIGSFTMHTNTSGSNNTVVGTGSDVATGNLTNATALGSGATAPLSNSIMLGNSAVTVVLSSGLNLITSDARFKTNIDTSGIRGINFIMKLRPVQYQLKAKELDVFLRRNMSDEAKKSIELTNYSQAESLIRTGFIAQEVETAAKQTGFNFDGVYTPKDENDYYAISYSSMVVPLVKGMQEQQATIEKQQKELEAQKALFEKQQQLILELTKRIEIIEHK